MTPERWLREKEIFDVAVELPTEAQQAYMRGDLETAKHQFQTVNRIDPKNPTAIGFLRRIQAESKAAANSGTVEKQLAAVTIPKVEFRESTLGSALALRLRMRGGLTAFGRCAAGRSQRHS